jgi:hypothetical protein
MVSMGHGRSDGERGGDARGLPRRTFVEVAALGASVALIGCGEWGRGQGSADLPAVLSDLGPGTAIDTWTIVAVHPITHGAIPIVLEAEDGERFQVDVMAKDPSFPAVGESEHFSVFVANAGDGRQATDERHGLGAMALAAALREREIGGAPLPELWTMAERTARAEGGTFRVPLG